MIENLLIAVGGGFVGGSVVFLLNTLWTTLLPKLGVFPAAGLNEPDLLTELEDPTTCPECGLDAFDINFCPDCGTEIEAVDEADGDAVDEGEDDG